MAREAGIRDETRNSIDSDRESLERERGPAGREEGFGLRRCRGAQPQPVEESATGPLWSIRRSCHLCLSLESVYRQSAIRAAPETDSVVQTCSSFGLVRGMPGLP